jgi:hypothetical protein
MRDNRSGSYLVTRAQPGNHQAWDLPVEQYALLVWFHLPPVPARRPDSGGVGQTVWLRLVDQLERIRDPAALPAWLATTSRECAKARGAAPRPHAAG